MKDVTIDENGVAWVTTGCGQVFGVVNAFEILDEDGIKYDGKSMEDMLGDYFHIADDFGTETQDIEFTFSNGETAFLKASSHGVDLV